MKKKKVWVIGLESTGTHWVNRILNAHPDIDAFTTSFPFDTEDRRKYCPYEDCDHLVVMCRDKTCHRLSVVAKGYEKDTPGQFTDFESIETIARRIASHNSNPVTFVSYEGLLLYREMYLSWLLSRIGVSDLAVQLAVDYQDGNVKYILPGADDLTISIVVKPSHAINERTATSLMKYASDHLIQYHVGPHVDWVNTNIGNIRYDAVKKISTQWCCWFDSDDEYINPFPDLSLFRDYDVLWFNYVAQKWGDQRRMMGKRPFAAASSPRIVAKTSFMRTWLKEQVASGYIREDIFVLHKVLSSGCRVAYFDYPLVFKHGGRCGQSDLFLNLHHRDAVKCWNALFTKRSIAAYNRKLVENRISEELWPVDAKTYRPI